MWMLKHALLTKKCPCLTIYTCLLIPIETIVDLTHANFVLQVAVFFRSGCDCSSGKDCVILQLTP